MHEESDASITIKSQVLHAIIERLMALQARQVVLVVEEAAPGGGDEALRVQAEREPGDPGVGGDAAILPCNHHQHHHHHHHHTPPAHTASHTRGPAPAPC